MEDAAKRMLPNCQPTKSPKDKLQSCHYAGESASSTELIMASSASEDYQTPPGNQHSSGHDQEMESGEMTVVDDSHDRKEKRPVEKKGGGAHQVFVEMPIRGMSTTEVNKDPKEKRRLPASVDGTLKKKKGDVFLDTLARACQLLNVEVKDGVGDDDIFATALKRGWIFPRPRWWPKDDQT